MGRNRGSFDDHPWPKDLPEGELGEMERQAIENLVKAATLAKAAGKLPGIWEERISEVLRPQIDWKDRLRRFVQTSYAAKVDFRLMPPAKKHLWRGIYLPSLTGEHLEIAVAIDTSGSVSIKMFQAFTSEVMAICDQFESYTIHFFQCDAKIQDARIIETGEKPPLQAFGRGGTSFRPVFEKVKEIPFLACLMYLTDGYPNDGWPEPLDDLPIIWVVSTDVAPPYGEHVKIKIK